MGRRRRCCYLGGQVTGNRLLAEDKAQLPHDARHAEEMPNKQQQQQPPRHAVYGTKHNIRESLAKVLSRIFEPLLQPFKVSPLPPHQCVSQTEMARG